MNDKALNIKIPSKLYEQLKEEAEKKNVSLENEEEIIKKIEERKIAKRNKDFILADKIRDELLSKGIKLIDTREGTTYELL